MILNLIRRQPPHHLCHLPVSVDPEPLLLGHARQLHILGVQLLLHDLLQRLQDQRLGFLQREGLVEFVLELCLRAFRAGADGFGVVAVEGTRRLGVISVHRLVIRQQPLPHTRKVIVKRKAGWGGVGVQLRPILINPRNQQCYPEWPAHDTLLPVRPLSESYCQVANTLGAALHPQRLVVMETVVLTLDAGMFDHGAGVGLETGHGAADMSVDLHDFLNRGGFEEGGGDAFFYAENDAGAGGDLSMTVSE